MIFIHLKINASCHVKDELRDGECAMKGLGTRQHFLEEENVSTPYLERTFELLLFAFANQAE